MAGELAYKDINGIRFFSARRLFVDTVARNSKACFDELLEAGGVELSGPDKRIAATPSVGVIAFGGLVFDWTSETAPDAVELQIGGSLTVTVGDFSAAIMQAAGLASAVSYLNPNAADLEVLGRRVVSVGHLSPLHLSTWSFLVLGLSTACELELNCQRDTVHLSRLTAARTSVQNKPVLAVPTWGAVDLNVFATVLAACDAVSAQVRLAVGGQDGLEVGNALFPLNKATACVVTGSTRNLLALKNQITDLGKEREYREIITKLVDALELLGASPN